MPDLKLDSATWQKLMWAAIILVGAGLLAWVLSLINKAVFKTIGRKKRGIHLAFFERLNKAVIVIALFLIALSLLDGGGSGWKTLLGGTAVVSAVAAFAAQDVIKDVIAGLMISLQKPFEIGDRIELSDGTVGVVDDMTNRHVVLIGTDTLRIIVPNSLINSMKIINYRFHSDLRAASFRFSVGYDSDTEFAKKVIREAVIACPDTVPGKKKADGELSYGEVYFMAFDSSALIMYTTVYYGNTTPTERILDQVNTAVKKALNENGIEIPYNYVNVVNVNAGEKE